MDGPANTAFPRDNGDSLNLIEVERSRRLLLQRLGILICFVIIFFDGATPKTDTRYVHKDEAVIEQSPRSQSSYITKLNMLVSSTRNLNSQNYYARNITGIYRGHWEVGGIRETSDNTKNISSKKITKAVTIQLRSTKLKNVADLDFVYGVARIYNAGLGGSDLFFPLQGKIEGVFLCPTNK
jgi:hypothetical protein